MDQLTLQPFAKPFDVPLAPPGSKSLTNRALVLAALSQRSCTLTNVLFADDTRHMLRNLGLLGIPLQIDEPARTVIVQGQSGRIPATSADLFCGNSGTTIRFLTALCTLGQGVYTLDGIERMRQRPIGQLGEMLRNLGARITYTASEGFPPIRIEAGGLPGGIFRFGAAQSSQYLSAVLMAAPYAKHELYVNLDPDQTSWPYVAMTMRLMTHFGNMVELERDPDTAEPRSIHVPRDPYDGSDYLIEPDASNATYFLAAAAIHPGSKVTIEGLGKGSVQGDVGFADVLHKMGAGLVFGRDFITITGPDRLQGIVTNLKDMPDTAQTLAVVALFAEGPTTIKGLHTLRHKETDRLAALRDELTKLGAEVEIEGDTLHIDPPERLKPATIATYDDHRMAMSFALAATKSAGVTLLDPQCVNKTYPDFFTDLERLRA
jgi:3-phosphoshikimate 1-carboxyvinyltransferase